MQLFFKGLIRGTYIAYGADFLESKISDNDQVLLNWQKENNVSPNNYYLIVGRFVPENNYELIIREYMKSNSNKDLVIISNVEDNYFYKELLKRTQFKQDKRIKFVGTVYNQDLLKKIREQAYGYFHGHEVGGTNPSLLEALAATKINLLLDVNFNREVGDNGAFYFNKEENNLAKLIDKADHLSYSEVGDLELKAKNRVKSEYSWEKIVTEYEELFLGEKWKEGKL
ncbi:glycosyltransferase [Shouchella clausii]|uniref:glycosyltransferase n=1 Tax=Shouchella clausii TaxID=79880 RepID=UPI0021C57107|nr:glycosyltransferase [Shouchella clausii]UXN54841.1 glycosyltransferase [Shouchella clausii]